MTDEQREAKIAACRVTEIDGGHEVVSPSGARYEVRTTTRLDDCGSMFFRTRCSCPACGDCVHIDAVERYVGLADDAPEIMERIE